MKLMKNLCQIMYMKLVENLLVHVEILMLLKCYLNQYKFEEVFELLLHLITAQHILLPNEKLIFAAKKTNIVLCMDVDILEDSVKVLW